MLSPARALGRDAPCALLKAAILVKGWLRTPVLADGEGGLLSMNQIMSATVNVTVATDVPPAFPRV